MVVPVVPEVSKCRVLPWPSSNPDPSTSLTVVASDPKIGSGESLRAHEEQSMARRRYQRGQVFLRGKRLQSGSAGGVKTLLPRMGR